MAKNPFTIVFENEAFVAINKPAGLLSIPDREQSEKSLKEMLIEKYGAIFTVHRLDKDTSGLIIFAKNEEAHKYFSRLFEERKIEKYYLGIVLGCPAAEKGEIDAPIAEHGVQKGLMTVNRNGKPALPVMKCWTATGIIPWFHFNCIPAVPTRYGYTLKTSATRLPAICYMVMESLFCSLPSKSVLNWANMMRKKGP